MSAEETIADRLSDAGYIEHAEDEDGGVPWISAPLDAVLRIVTAAQGATDDEVRVLAQWIAQAACDWIDVESDEHEHGLACTNWQAYTADARAALVDLDARAPEPRAARAARVRAETQTAEGGPWTSHGHPVPGVTVDGPGRPPVARCGGPALCPVCQRDRTRIEQETQP